MMTDNLHGINSGRFLVIYLSNDSNNLITATQEHWLPPNGSHEINNIHPIFYGSGVLAVTSKLSRGIY
jgi:hypothetical protein